MRITTRVLTVALATAAGTVLVAPPAAAGVDWFGIGFRVGNVNVSLGYHDYPEYSDAWVDPSWNMDYELMLDGYGEWVYVSGLGRVWRPYVNDGWRPYTYGRWVRTSMGWTWLSYEPWGYAPHHYGEWARSTYGWVWVPGYTYYPANVVWMQGGGYVGWYPRGPSGWSHSRRSFWRGYDRGYDRGYRTGERRGYDRGYGDGYWDGWDDANHATWTEWRHMGASDISRYAADPAYVSRQVGRSRVMPLEHGPAPSLVQRYTGQPVREYAVAERRVQAGDRAVRAVRVEGMDSAIRSNARAAVTRGLAPEVSRKLERGERVTPQARQLQAGGGDRGAVRGRQDAARVAPSAAQGRPAAVRPGADRNGRVQAAPRGNGRQERVAPRGDVRQERAAPRSDVRQERTAPQGNVRQERGRPAPSVSQRPAPSRGPVTPQARERSAAGPQRAPAARPSQPQARRPSQPQARPSQTQARPSQPQARRPSQPQARQPEAVRGGRGGAPEQGRGPVIVPRTRSAAPPRQPAASPQGRRQAPAPRAVPQRPSQSAPERGRGAVRQAPTQRDPRATAPAPQARGGRTERAAPQRTAPEAKKPERGKPRPR